MSEANQELVRRHFEETEDFVEHAAAPFAQSAPGRGKGAQAMRASAEWLLAQFPDLHMTIEAVIAAPPVSSSTMSLQARAVPA